MAKKKKEGMLGKALRGLNATNLATGVRPIRVKPKPSTVKKVTNLNKTFTVPKTTAAKAKAQKLAIQKRIDKRIKDKKK